MKDKDNIMDFSELKKSMEKKTSHEEKNSPISDIEMQKFFEELGIPLDNKVLTEILSTQSVDDMVEMVQSGKFSTNEIEELLSGLKNFEEKLSNEKKTYRAFGQWMPFHKPYNISTFFPIELVRKIADKIEISYSPMDSKNNIIEKIKPHLSKYLLELFTSLDEELMNLFGQVVYSDGKKLVESIFSEEVELQIDYLQRHGLITRLKENNHHYLVIPEEIFFATSSVDFIKVSKYNKVNTAIVKTTIAFANTYGAFPKSLLQDKIVETCSSLAQELDLDLQKYLQEYIQQSFAKGIAHSGLYPTVVVGDEYINHGVVEFTKYLIDIQNENITEYRPLSDEEIKTRGKSLYHDDSISLRQIVSMMQENNSLDRDEVEQLSNLIYTFSYLEFEPSLILQILEVRYNLPEGKDFGKFHEILKAYYKNGEKWILKGNTSYEANNKNSNFDASKIVKVDFMNKK